MTATVSPRLVRRLRTAGLLLILGLIVESATLFWSHPTAFLVFLGVGGVLVAASVLLYLRAIVSEPWPGPPPPA